MKFFKNTLSESYYITRKKKDQYYFLKIDENVKIDKK